MNDAKRLAAIIATGAFVYFLSSTASASSYFKQQSFPSKERQKLPQKHQDEYNPQPFVLPREEEIVQSTDQRNSLNHRPDFYSDGSGKNRRLSSPRLDIFPRVTYR